MRAAPALTAVVVLTSLTLAGCLGVTSAPDSAEVASTAQSSDPEPRLNLTIEIADRDAEWQPDKKVVPLAKFGKVEVTVRLNVSLTLDGEPTIRDIGGFAKFTKDSGCWGDECLDSTDNTGLTHRRASYAALGGGNFTVEVGPVEFVGPLLPPVGEPYCESISIWVWGSVWDRDRTAWDADLVGTEMCTQSYP